MELNLQTVVEVFSSSDKMQNQESSTLIEVWESHPSFLDLCFEVFHMEYDPSRNTVLFCALKAANVLLSSYGPTYSEDIQHNLFDSVFGLITTVSLPESHINKSLSILARIVSVNASFLEQIAQLPACLMIKAYLYLYDGMLFYQNQELKNTIIENTQALLSQCPANTPQWLHLFEAYIQKVNMFTSQDPLIEMIDSTNLDPNLYPGMCGILSIFSNIDYSIYLEDEESFPMRLLEKFLEYADNLADQQYERAAFIYSSIVDYGSDFFINPNNYEFISVLFDHMFTSFTSSTATGDLIAQVCDITSSSINDIFNECENSQEAADMIIPIVIEPFLTALADVLPAVYQNRPDDLNLFDEVFENLSEKSSPVFEQWLSEIITECNPVTLFIVSRIKDKGPYAQALMENLEIDEGNATYAIDFIRECALYCEKDQREKGVSLAFQLLMELQTEQAAQCLHAVARQLPKLFMDNASEILTPLITDVSRELLPDIVSTILYGSFMMDSSEQQVTFYNGAINMVISAFNAAIEANQIREAFDICIDVIHTLSRDLTEFESLFDHIQGDSEISRMLLLGFDARKLGSLLKWSMNLAHRIQVELANTALLYSPADEVMDCVADFVGACIIRHVRNGQEHIFRLISINGARNWAHNAITVCASQELLKLITNIIAKASPPVEMASMLDWMLDNGDDEAASTALMILNEFAHSAWNSLRTETSEELQKREAATVYRIQFVLAFVETRGLFLDRLERQDMPKAVNATLRLLQTILYLRRNAPESVMERVEAFFDANIPAVLDNMYRGIRFFMPLSAVESVLTLLRTVCTLEFEAADVVADSLLGGVMDQENHDLFTWMFDQYVENTVMKPRPLVLFVLYHLIPRTRV